MAIIRSTRICRGAIGGKTGKTAVLPEFCKIECGGGSGSGCHIMAVLPGPCARAALTAPLHAFQCPFAVV